MDDLNDEMTAFEEPVQRALEKIRGPRVYAAIANVMADIGGSGISKDRKNGQGWSYRGIDDVYNACSGPMAARGLVVMPRTLSRQQEERRSSRDGALFWTFLEAEFDFCSVEDGSKHTVRCFGEAMDSGDKSTGKAFTYAYRDALIKVFCIPVEGVDADADSTTHEVYPKTLIVQPRHEEMARTAIAPTHSNGATLRAEVAQRAVTDATLSGPPSTVAQKARIRELMSGKGISLTDAVGLSKNVTGTAGSLTEKQADAFIAALEVFGS